MACNNSYTLGGLNNICKQSNLGGIKEIYAIPYEYLLGTTVDTLTNFIVPSVDNGYKNCYTYQLPRNTGSMTSTLVNGETNYPYFETELNIVFHKLDTPKRLEVMALAHTPIAVMVKDGNGKIWFLGKDNYVECTAGSAQTGTNVSDANQYTLTFKDTSYELPYEVSEETLESIIYDMRNSYLTFEAIEDNTNITLRGYTNVSSLTIEVSVDETTWSSKTTTNVATTIATLNAGEKLYLRGENASYDILIDGTSYPTAFNMSKPTYVYGNIMSLIYKDNFANQTTLESGYTFYGLFRNSKIVSHNKYKLLLPATTLRESCYTAMFGYCTNLTTAPELPATELANYCYNAMFQRCTSLVNAPALPATTLANNCYYNMFAGCSSLETAPALPATTLANDCYSNMFDGCTSLVAAPELPATAITRYCYAEMFKNCSSLIVAVPELPATTLAESCYYCMFEGCSNLIVAPELPATTLANRCYYGMYIGCTALENAPELPATTLVNNCYYGMFVGCTSLNYISCLATDISASNCTNDWVNGVSATGTFVKAPEMSDWTTGNNGIPNGWEVEDVQYG